MSKAKVKVGMYQATHYCETRKEGAVISTEEYDELVKSKVEEFKDDLELFSDYLSDNYTQDEIWYMIEEDKEKVLKDYEERCLDWANDELCEQWDYFEIVTTAEIQDVIID